MINLKQLLKESDDTIVEKFLSLLPKYDLEFHSWDVGDAAIAFRWRGSTYPTLTDKERIVKVALDRTNIFGHDGNVWIGDPSHPMLNGYVVQAIVTNPEDRGKGKAREILKRILAAADEAGLLLKLEPVPMKDFIKKGQPHLSRLQLQKWYGKYGFKKDPSANIMMREPIK
jgi:GNAT superfamily N-acetyltransferase